MAAHSVVSLGGLQHTSVLLITGSVWRVSLDWGILIPVELTYTNYVGVDSLLGYVSILLNPDSKPTLENALKKWWHLNFHLIGKDILRFESVNWPDMLMSAGIPVSKHWVGYGFLTEDGRKKGKSLGNTTLAPVILVNHNGADEICYGVLKEIVFEKDGDHNETDLIDIINADLAKDWVNLLNQTLKMVQKYCDSPVVEVKEEEILFNHLLKIIDLGCRDYVTRFYQSLVFGEAAQKIFILIRANDNPVNLQALWGLYGQGIWLLIQQGLYALWESVRLAAYLISSIIPQIFTPISQQLGYSFDFNEKTLIKDTVTYANQASLRSLLTYQRLGHPNPVFMRLEQA
jgi:methionyl-tRNA synthetase